MMRKIHWYKGSEPPFVNPFVMVIDDSATVRIIIETCLRRAGFAVNSFNDGIDAIQWLSQPDAALPALIFLDIGLPHMDGYEVARQIKAQPLLNATVIVMLSRRDGIVDRLKGRLAGASAHLPKPFKTHNILQMVETHLGHSTATVRREKE